MAGTLRKQSDFSELKHTILNNEALLSANRLIGAPIFISTFDTIWGLMKSSKINAIQAFASWHSSGGPPKSALSKFVIPYANFHEILLLGFIEKKEILSAQMLILM